MDVHKDTIAVALVGREAPAYCGEIGKLARAHGGELILFCYEAGPRGYEVYRQLTALGFDCEVVAPSRIPKAPGERIKTDRRDACKLARLSRSGELTGVCVPDEEQEAMRDLVRVRARADLQERRAQDAPATGRVSAAPWSALVAQSLDAVVSREVPPRVPRFISGG